MFANLVMRGQIHSALRYLCDDNGGGVLPLSDDVMRQLKEKHPEAQEARLGSLLFGPVEDIPDIVFLEIDGEMVRDAALGLRAQGDPKEWTLMVLGDCWRASLSRSQAQIFVTLLQ